MTRLTPAQRDLLTAVAEGKVYHFDSFRAMAPYDLLDGGRKVTAAVRRLHDAGLVEPGESERWGHGWHVTDAGRAALEENR